MVRPAEKIDSIRINQISGLGGANGGGGDTGKAPVNQAFDAMLGAALQLPAMRKLGEELGMNFEGGLAGLLDDPAEPGRNTAASQSGPGTPSSEG